MAPAAEFHGELGSCDGDDETTRRAGSCAETCHLRDVFDWAEAVVCSSGLNLHSVVSFAGAMHLNDDWRWFPDRAGLEETFARKVGGLSDETARTIKRARMLGVLLPNGFICRPANQPEPVPIQDDDSGSNMERLDAFLINLTTRFDGID